MVQGPILSGDVGGYLKELRFVLMELSGSQGEYFVRSSGQIG
jgi:hypothetical protein